MFSKDYDYYLYVLSKFTNLIGQSLFGLMLNKFDFVAAKMKCCSQNEIQLTVEILRYQSSGIISKNSLLLDNITGKFFKVSDMRLTSQHSIAFHIETSHLIRTANQTTGFYRNLTPS